MFSTDTYRHAYHHYFLKIDFRIVIFELRNLGYKSHTGMKSMQSILINFIA